MGELIVKNVSALAGAVANTTGGKNAVVVREMGLQGMLTLRANLQDPSVQAAVKALTHVEMPAKRRIALRAGAGVAWMSPDEVLIILPHTKSDDAAQALARALSGTQALVANVSDARAVFTLAGAGARDVLARLAPVDLSAERFAAGEIRRTRMGQIPAAFWMSGPKSAPHAEITIVVFRSVAQYAFDILANASTQGAVGFYR